MQQTASQDQAHLNLELEPYGSELALTPQSVCLLGTAASGYDSGALDHSEYLQGMSDVFEGITAGVGGLGLHCSSWHDHADQNCFLVATIPVAQCLQIVSQKHTLLCSPYTIYISFCTHGRPQCKEQRGTPIRREICWHWMCRILWAVPREGEGCCDELAEDCLTRTAVPGRIPFNELLRHR